MKRLTTELKRHQLRYPRAAAEAAAEAEANAGEGGDWGKGEKGGEQREDADDLPPWVTSSEVMSPLLAAYDARIQVGCGRACEEGAFFLYDRVTYVLFVFLFVFCAFYGSF